MVDVLKNEKDPIEINNLGVRYRHGNGVQQSHEKAFSLFLEAAELGCDEAYRNVAKCYILGQGTDVSFGEARKWLKRSEDNGSLVASRNLTLLYVMDPNQYDPKKAFELLKDLADKGCLEAKGDLPIFSQYCKCTSDSDVMSVHERFTEFTKVVRGREQNDIPQWDETALSVRDYSRCFKVDE